MRTMFGVTVLLALFGLILAGCVASAPQAAGPAPAESSGEEAMAQDQHGGTLTVALAEQPSTLNAYGGMSDRKTLMHVLEPLVGLDKQTLEPVPLLATSWEVPDEQTYVFTLREGVKFHDGTDFNAEAVKFVFDYMLDPDNASPRASDFDRIESVEVTGDHEVTFHLKEPFGVFLSILAIRGFMMSPTQLQSAAPEDLDAAPAGTGPFKVVEWVKDDKIVLERFEDYWDGDLPYLDQLVYKMLPDHTVKMVSLRTGEVDLVDNVPSTEIQAIQDDSNFVFAASPSTGYRSLYLNTEAPPFNDVRLRQALAWATDREKLIQLGALGIGAPAQGPLAPSQWAFDPDFQPYTRDVEKAKALVEEAGYPDGFSFTMKVPNSPEEIRMAEVLQQQFAEAGINMDMVTGEYTALRSTVVDGDYEAFFVGWLGGPDPDSNMWNSFHSDGWFNWVRYVNPEVDQLLDEARSISDIEQRAELYRKAQQIISEEAAMIFLKYPYFAADGQAHSTRVNDFVPDPLQDMHFKEVWVDSQ